MTGALSQRSLVVEAVDLGHGRTALRADGEDIWITPRPASEKVPQGARLLKVRVTDFAHTIQGPLSVTAHATIARVRALINALPAGQPGTVACPMDWGVTIHLDFDRANGAPLARAAIDTTGCGGVELWIAGRQRPGLQSTPALIGGLDKALGVKLDTLPPGAR